MASTLLDVIKQLQKEGNKIEFRHRSDGGVIITAINGVRYVGAQGNTTARAMAGVSLSPARQEQLHYNVKKYIRGQKKVKLPSFDSDEELLRMLRKVQRAYRSTKGKGRITKRKLRFYFKTEGREGAMEYLNRRLAYAQGIAYDENVMWLAQRMRRKASEVSSDELYELANQISNMKGIFREEWIEPCYEVLYNIPKTISVEQGIAQIKTIIHL